MTITDETTVSSAEAPRAGTAVREVVAIVLEHHGRIALLRRSSAVHHDQGLWHCVTGYLDPGTTPRQQAFVELYEETGLTQEDVVLERCRPLLLPDRSGAPWLVHTFRASTSRRRLRINGEHDAYRWAKLAKVRRFSNRVAWLGTVLEATLRCDQGRSPGAPEEPRSSPGDLVEFRREGGRSV
ncbi:8-oxo-dGTP pyrophosphatase MutT (NUDIX family) [Sinomonas atrocyanea]|jgi:8-oxo-dGTP pyrophosphatase MutT (NUDIX family)|uniref:NUDIX domain-containing protein n=1 Tax=Sinomonas atrocyanea TaxID=37927 RepID=UPI002789F342|nr:NUDIX domain-containing protein [Sinomonas atrocyanea]MDQ0260583.1 8-oxo-dGTP pyrophosphatase MutT (NUDIX family) [Sinomonas atrocyanea]